MTKIRSNIKMYVKILLNGSLFALVAYVTSIIPSILEKQYTHIIPSVSTAHAEYIDGDPEGGDGACEGSPPDSDATDGPGCEATDAT